MTRAMLVTVLWRYAGQPQAAANPFTDVPGGEWYTQAVAWAAENGVVNGIGGGKFDPNGRVTREQAAAILFRYAQKVGAASAERADLSGFPDANAVSDYASDAMRWVVAEGIIGGSREYDGRDWLKPQGSATRAQVAAILMRYIENVTKSGKGTAAPRFRSAAALHGLRGMVGGPQHKAAALRLYVI